MAPFKARFKPEDFRKFRDPGLLFGGGLLAGLLLFLLWLAFRPADDKASLAAPSTVAGTAQQPLSAGDGVLGGITGQMEPGQPGSASIGPGELEPAPGQGGADALAGGAGAEPDDPAAANPPEASSDEQAIADGLLEALAPDRADAAPGPELQTYYVEVMGASGETEFLEVNAESAGHARAIVRDYRGNPRLIRGPSLRPLN